MFPFAPAARRTSPLSPDHRTELKWIPHPAAASSVAEDMTLACKQAGVLDLVPDGVSTLGVANDITLTSRPHLGQLSAC
jgi:hypothetical protein